MTAQRDGYVVTVNFAVEPGSWKLFRDAVLENAHASLTREPGCRTFDVCEDEHDARIFLYEVYDSRKAFDIHLASEHFRRFDDLTATWVSRKQVLLLNRLVLTADGLPA